MIAKQTQEKGILAKLLTQGIRILLIKECKKISNLKIDIISSSTQIIKGKIEKINIFAEDINYKNLLFDLFELEANDLEINLKIIKKEIYFKNNPIIKFKISLSQNSLRTVLFSNSWNWIKKAISKEILNQNELEDVKITNNKFLIKGSINNNNVTNLEQINIKTEKGKIYLENKTYNKNIQIPIEDKIYIENVTIENNLVNISVSSSISF